MFNLEDDKVSIVKVNNGYLVSWNKGATYVFGSFKELVEHLKETISLDE